MSTVIPASCLTNIAVANRNDKVFKEESVLSFDSPESEHGIYVCMQSFYSVGKRDLELFSSSYKSNLFLNIKRIRTKRCVDACESTPTRLAIGVPGGFSADEDLFDIQEEYKIVYFDGKAEHDFALSTDPPIVPAIVMESARSILASDSWLVAIVDHSVTNIGWSGDIRKESKYSDDLKQIGEGKRIPPSGWKCEACDLTNNLWLNLTDGSIHCGRKYFDGTGGNGHAIAHYEATGYPLAVQLGTIGANCTADVFSYPEGDMVTDKNLSKHLAFFGICPGEMAKSEKSILEKEIDLNRQLDEKWASSRILESDRVLSYLSGKGLTPIQNIGSSCYMNVVLQVVFSTEQFRARYFDAYPDILRDPNNCGLRALSPVDNLEVQMAKMADGLLSGFYSALPEQHRQSIRPYMLKHALCRSHPDFSTNKQQDAAEFFLYCMQELKRNSHWVGALSRPTEASAAFTSSRRVMDATGQFLFRVEQRSEYVGNRMCRYEVLDEYTIQLPLDIRNMTLNAQEVEDYQENVRQLKDRGEDASLLTPVEPVLSLMDCFAKWAADEVIENVAVPGREQQTDSMAKRLRFQTFPDYLAVVTQRFGLNEDWTPKKLQVRVCVPEQLDLNHLRAKGPQDGETIIDKESGLTLEQEAVIAELRDFGYSEGACRVAVSMTKSKVDAAELLLDKGEALCKGQAKPTQPPQIVADGRHMESLQTMGFSRQHSRRALVSTENDLERAVDWLFNHPDDETSSDLVEEVRPETVSDGPGSYELWAFISHIGKSTACGHYVAHIRKRVEDREQWVIFDDERVALSVMPPVEDGYIYFFRRK